MRSALLLLPLAFLGAIRAQTPEQALRSQIMGVHYAPVAEAARVQGTVHLNLKSNVVTLLSGPPVLTRTAVASARALGLAEPEANLDITYHFVLVNTAISVARSITVPRGNAFERAIWRMFGLKTERVIVDYSCQEGVSPPNDFTIAGSTIEIWIYGRSRCLMIETATLVANR
jgi:hypothetical protein